MLTAKELASLGYVDSLKRKRRKSEVLTSVQMTFDLIESTSESEDRMDELKELLKELVKVTSDIPGIVVFHTGIDKKHKKMRHSALYDTPAVLDAVFVQILDIFVKIVRYATMVETICTTSPDALKKCEMSLSRFYVPPKFLILPSLVGECRTCNGGTRKNHMDFAQKKLSRISKSSTSSIIRNIGKWKIKDEFVNDEAKWNALHTAMQAYNEAMLGMEGVLYIENALSKQTKEFYFAEHYLNRDAIVKRAGCVAMHAEELSAAMIPLEIFTFCSKDNFSFCETILEMYNPTKWAVMESYGIQRR